MGGEVLLFSINGLVILNLNASAAQSTGPAVPSDLTEPNTFYFQPLIPTKPNSTDTLASVPWCQYLSYVHVVV